MTGLPTGLRLSELELPERLESPAGRKLRQVAELGRVADDHEFGNHDLVPAAGELLAEMRDREFVRRRRWMVVDRGGACVGSGVLVLPMADNRHQATIGVTVLPSSRRQGIGTALFAAAADVARADGRTVLLGQTHHGRFPSQHAVTPPEVTLDPVSPDVQSPDGAGAGAARVPDADARADILPAATGAGALWLGDPAVRFALRHGFTLEQTAVHHVLELPADAVTIDRLRRSAEERADGDYSLVPWISRGPGEWIDDYAALLGAMSTDEPNGDVDVRAEKWDAARVRSYEAGLIDAGTFEYVMTAMHVPTRRLVGYTIIEVGARSDESARQCDTLVAPAHRGRRLGQLMKTANLARVQSAHPGLKRLHTWNATENVHMIAVNRAQGYVPAGLGGQWQRRDSAIS